MSELRQRKTPRQASKPPGSSTARTSSSSSSKGFPFQLAYVAVLAALGLAYYYLNPTKVPLLQRASSALKARSSTTSEAITLTDAELSRYDGSDPKLPIYIAINGTIFDVTEGSSFYGPTGAYNHFAGRDATRAWITECFAPEEQLTWDLRGVEEMFVPLYVDEMLEMTADGQKMPDGTDIPEALKQQAVSVIERIGRVDEEEKARRFKKDIREATVKIEEAVQRWDQFFKTSGKYLEVGRVVGRKPLKSDRPRIPLCEEARKRKPKVLGKLEGAMGDTVLQEGDSDSQGRAPNFLKGSRSKV